LRKRRHLANEMLSEEEKDICTDKERERREKRIDLCLFRVKEQNRFFQDVSSCLSLLRCACLTQVLVARVCVFYGEKLTMWY